MLKIDLSAGKGRRRRRVEETSESETSTAAITKEDQVENVAAEKENHEAREEKKETAKKEEKDEKFDMEAEPSPSDPQVGTNNPETASTSTSQAGRDAGDSSGVLPCEGEQPYLSIVVTARNDGHEV